MRRKPPRLAQTSASGDLSIDYMLDLRFRRPLRQAHLRTSLADPKIVRIAEATMVLVGLQT